METGFTQDRAYGISGAVNYCEYLLVVHPGVELHNKIAGEQEYFSLHYQERVPVKTKPHIELARFKAREEMEPTLIRWMHRIISNQSCFKLTLSNYSGFPPNTVYLRIPEPEAFQQLARGLHSLNDYVKSYDCPTIKLNSKPHLSIAQKLTETNYLKAMMDFSQRSFHEVFEVKELILLRRRHAFDSYQPINKFGLQPA